MRRRAAPSERDEGEVRRRRSRLAARSGRSRAFVPSRSVTRGSSRSSLVELRPADIDREHGGRAALEQAIGEAAGGCAEVEAAKAGDIDGEGVEGGFELVAAAADVPFGGDQLDGRGCVEHVRGLHEDERTDPGAPGHDQALRALPRFGEAAFHQQQIRAKPGHDWIVAQQTRRRHRAPAGGWQHPASRRFRQG